LLIAGSADFANPTGPAASPQMASLLAAWGAPGQKFSDRAAAAAASLAGHLTGDGAKDSLSGGDGLDLFFVGAEDLVHDRKTGDVVTRI
jgi:hypothetical protein